MSVLPAIDVADSLTLLARVVVVDVNVELRAEVSCCELILFTGVCITEASSPPSAGESCCIGGVLYSDVSKDGNDGTECICTDS